MWVISTWYGTPGYELILSVCELQQPMMLSILSNNVGLYLLILCIGYNYIKLLVIITESLKGYFAYVYFLLFQLLQWFI